MTVIFLIAILILFVALRIIASVRMHNDPRLGTILIAASISRIAVGILNHFHGPLPGARIDAVMFDETARNLAMTAGGPVEFAVAMGPLGYASLLSFFYLIAGYHFVVPTVVNLVFVVEFLILIYGMTLQWGGKPAARLAVLLTAFYPTSLIYTAVPLREAPLLFGLALYVKCLIDYYHGRATLLNWKMWAGLGLIVWLHDGFALALFLIPIAIWFRKRELPVWNRIAGPLVAIIVAAVAFVVAIRIFEFSKLPANPMQLLDAEWLARMREVKAAYGVGYGQVAPTWGGIVVTAPVMVFAFLAAPFPFWGEDLGDLPKMIEGVLSLVIVIGAVASVLASSRSSGRTRRKFLLAMYLYLVVVFAMGTGNTGIAARHRAKFVWMPIMIASIALARRRSRDEEDALPPEEVPPGLPHAPGGSG